MIYFPSSAQFKSIKKCLPSKINVQFSQHALNRAYQNNVQEIKTQLKCRQNTKAICVENDKLESILVNNRGVWYVLGAIKHDSAIVITLSTKKNFMLGEQDKLNFKELYADRHNIQH